MRFDGSVQDLGGVDGGAIWEMAFKGKDLDGLKDFVLKRVKDKGLEVVGGMVERREGGGWVVSVRVRGVGGVG